MKGPRHPEVQELVRAVMTRLGARNARQLADALGMTDIDRERRVRRWIAGENAPDFRHTMNLLAAGGLLQYEWAAKADAPAASPPALREELAEIRALVERLLDARDRQAPARSAEDLRPASEASEY